MLEAEVCTAPANVAQIGAPSRQAVGQQDHCAGKDSIRSHWRVTPQQLIIRSRSPPTASICHLTRSEEKIQAGEWGAWAECSAADLHMWYTSEMGGPGPRRPALICTVVRRHVDAWNQVRMAVPHIPNRPGLSAPSLHSASPLGRKLAVACLAPGAVRRIWWKCVYGLPPSLGRAHCKLAPFSVIARLRH